MRVSSESGRASRALPYRRSAIAPPSSTAAPAIHTCQCEKKPFEMAKLDVQRKSAATRQNPSAQAITAAGVSNAPVTKAAWRLGGRFTRTRGPVRSRILTRIPVQFHFTST